MPVPGKTKLIKFPPSRAGKDVKCPEYARGRGMLKLRFDWYISSGHEQSMKPMIGKSIDQSMTIDALLVNWHPLASANRWPIDNHTKVVATHRLSSIGVKKSRYPTQAACTYTHSQYAQMVMFEIWIRSPDCLYTVAWFQKSTTETHFKTHLFA